MLKSLVLRLGTPGTVNPADPSDWTLESTNGWPRVMKRKIAVTPWPIPLQHSSVNPNRS